MPKASGVAGRIFDPRYAEYHAMIGTDKKYRKYRPVCPGMSNRSRATTSTQIAITRQIEAWPTNHGLLAVAVLEGTG
jgi:hypothetical protein